MVMVMDLPADLLADVFRRLRPRDLAAARCVHSSWHAIIDTGRLMHLVPLPLAGIFINFHNHDFTELFARPSPAPAIVSAKFHHYLPDAACDAIVMDHCNGLLLLSGGYVVNPATRQWAKLPSPRPPRRYRDEHFRDHEYIAFDPAVSPHYEVLVVPQCPYKQEILDRRMAEWEWPPSPMLLHAFSSRMNRWEERSFERQGEAFGTVADVPWCDDNKCGVYWRGHLYVHHYFVMRICLSSGKYQVIKLPQDIGTRGTPQLRLGRSKKGVYLASIASGRLQVWILDESCARLEWVLKYQADIWHMFAHRSYNKEVHGSWIMEDVNYHSYHDSFPDYKEQAPQENKFEWDSDNEDVLGTKDKIEGRCRKDIDIIGFHPHKEVVFLTESLERGLACHFSTSKLQDLGYMYPTRYDWFAEGHRFIESSFPYTPCWTTELPTSN